jgi:hypothetical protein
MALGLDRWCGAEGTGPRARRSGYRLSLTSGALEPLAEAEPWPDESVGSPYSARRRCAGPPPADRFLR